jgi:hypothetical protein
MATSDDHLAVAVGQNVGLDDGGPKAHSRDFGSYLFSSGFVPNVRDGNAFRAFLCQIDGNSGPNAPRPYQ